MIKIIYKNINDVDIDKLEKSFSLLPKYRQDIINKLKNEDNKHLSLLAGLLLHNEVGDLDKEITFNEYGKGYLPKSSNLYFSISHSKDMVLLVISDKEVGCDIQYMKNSDYSVAKRFFTNEEYNEIINSTNPKETFFRIWSIKEAYLKCIGVGLSKPLSSVVVKGNSISDSNYKVYRSEIIDNDYYISIVVNR